MITLAEKIAVMQASEAGKKIEMRSWNFGSLPWKPIDVPLWNWGDYEYRIEPVQAECWAVIDRDNDVHSTWPTKDQAIGHCIGPFGPHRVTKMREVIE